MRHARKLGLALAAVLSFAVAACVVAGAQKAGAAELHPALYALENCGDSKNEGDTYISSVQYTTNYGTAEMLWTGYAATIYRTYIRFDLSGIPTGASISSATVYMYPGNSTSGSKTVTMWWFDNVDWSENVVKWSSPPIVTENHYAGSTTYTGQNVWMSWDAKTAVENSMARSNKKLSLLFKYLDDDETGSHIIGCGGKDSVSYPNHPYVEVNYTVPSDASAPYCENSTNPSSVSAAPYFNAVYTDTDAGDSAQYAQIQVGTSAGDSSLWDSGWVDIADITTGARCEDISYAGTALSRGATYHWRIRFKDSNATTGNWSSDQMFTTGPLVTSISASATVIDRKVDEAGSGAVENTIVYITVREGFGRDWINKCYIWIRDNTDAVVADNVEVTGYENVNSTTKRFSYTFDPDNSAQVGYFDIKALGVDNDGTENIKDYTASGFGHQLFNVDDLTVTGSLVTANPVHKTAISGAISRASGDAASADNVCVVDNNEGTLTPDSFTNTAYNDNYSLVSPTRLYRNNTGTVYVWARDDNLDGKCSSLSYTVMGDNATVTLGNINNQVGQSVVNFTVAWNSDSSNMSSGTAYHQDNTSYEATITNGSGSFTLSHSTWKITGATVITIYDNANRPLHNVSNATFNTDKLAWAENQPLSGTNDNASLTIKITYNDGSTNNTIRAELLAGTVDNGQITSDTNGLMAWNGINLPDNTSGLTIWLDNVFDSRTDKVINARNVEDAAIYTPSSVSSFTIDGGASSTTSSTVTLAISASSVGSNVYQMCFSNDNVSWSTWEGYSASKSWSLSSGDGSKTVYVKVRDSILNESNTSSASITKTTTSNPPPSGGSSPSGGGYTPPDTTLPTLAVLEPAASIVGENVTIRVRASDASGIDSESISVKLDGGMAQHSWAGDIITSTFVRLSAGSHLVVVKVNDASTNHNQSSINISFTVAPSAVENAEAVTSAMPAHTGVLAVTVGTLRAKENGAAVFDNENFSITSVVVAVSEHLGENEAIENVGVSAQVLENAPAEAADLPEKVATYAYLEISTTAPKNTLASVTINFKVSKAWLQASGMSPLAVTLYHLENGAWVELATTKVGEDNLYIFYSAVTPSLSPFMIGAKILFLTFSLQLPATPLEVENGYAQVMIWITNPTANTLVKHCELRFDNNANVGFFDIVVDSYENKGVTVYVRVEGVALGIHDVKLYDADTNTVLDAGQVTLLGMAEQSKTPVVVAAPPSPIPSIAVIGTAIGMVVGVGMLYITGRIPKIKMPSVKLPSVKTPKNMPPTHLAKRSFGVRKRAEELGEESLVVQMYHNILMPAAHEFLEEDSPVVQGYYSLLSPVARERTKKNKVKHVGRAAKPYRSEK